ncbi:MAG: 50S ribosomal protein L22 [Candidatus Muiribacteriaceae bacterium]
MERQAVAHQKHIRISPQKMNQVMKELRGKDVEEAFRILAFTNKKAAFFIGKLLNSAVANAVNNHSMDADRLYISELFSNAGPIMKRISPQPMGRAFRINKRTAHNTMILKERAEKEVKRLEPEKEEEVQASEKKTVKKAAVKKTAAKKPAAEKKNSKSETSKEEK